MTMSSALSNAISGLNVASRAAGVVSSNIANAMTDGYGLREAQIVSRVTGTTGAGARVAGILRHEDASLSGARRVAEADRSGGQVETGFLSRIEAAIGTPDQPGSLAARLATFEARLVDAANAPATGAHHAAAVDAAVALAAHLNDAQHRVQDARLAADGDIAEAVTTLNDTLQALSDLNIRIRKGAGGGRDISALQDGQAQLLDRISGLVPVHTRRDDLGALQVFTDDGLALLDGVPAQFAFTPVHVMTPDLAPGTGLSGLSVNGRATQTEGPAATVSGGRLAALFALRDDRAPSIQNDLDTVAADLALRLQDTAVDPTLAPGDAGLFTDGGSAVDAAAITGLAGRLQVNAALRPEAGGATWRLRDGIGATAPGPEGRSDLLRAGLDALAAPRPVTTGSAAGQVLTAADLVAAQISTIGRARAAAEIDLGHIAAQHGALVAEEKAQGVDTDAQMQRLLQIEQSYAANVQVIAAVQDMMDILMGIGR